MGLFDFLKKKPEPAAAPEPVKYKLVFNELELSEGFPRITHYENEAMDKDYYKAEKMDDQGESEAAFDIWLELARKGHVDSMTSIAYAYLNGRGVAVNRGEYFRWLYRAAYFGSAFAQIDLADEYEMGYEDEHMIYVEKDPVESFYWLQKAANQEIYYLTCDDEDDEDEAEDDDTWDDEEENGEEETDDTPYSPNEYYVKDAQDRVEKVIASIQNGTFEGTPEQAQKIMNMYNR